VRHQVRTKERERAEEGRREGRKQKSIVSAPLEVSISEVEVGKLMVGLVITGEVLWGLEVKSRKGRAAGSLLVGNDTHLAPGREGFEQLRSRQREKGLRSYRVAAWLEDLEDLRHQLLIAGQRRVGLKGGERKLSLRSLSLRSKEQK